MGKATRWILGMKKAKENVDNNSNYGEKNENKRWSFAKSGKDSEGLSRIPMRSLGADSENEQNKHAIAVAAATAAAADAAVAAAQAAVAVVRLTSQGRGALFTGGRESLAAMKIQAVFRGFLARKALRALKGLVKLQALIRGYLVRKRAAATLYSMQALMRAQSAIRSKGPENFEETRTEFYSKRLSAPYDPCDESPKIVEIDTCGPKSRSRRMSTCTSDCNYDQYYQAITLPLHDFDWGFIKEDYKFATAQNTPRFGCSGRVNAPATPPKSVCGDSFFRPYSNCPSYMASTQSFKAKLRSLSTPKQRPEPGPKKRLSLNEIMASRTSFSGIRMQRS